LGIVEMVDVLTKKQRSYCMSRILGSNTGLEITFKKHMRSGGITGFRKGTKVVGKPDYIFPALKVAVFLDGCFWHGCPKCYREPDTNKTFWKNKISKNKKRDREVSRLLKKDGWKIKRFWGHQIKKKPDSCVSTLKRILEKRCDD